jgi:hypothetical protein
MSRLIILALSFFVLITPALAQGDVYEDRAVSYAKGILVSRLDSRLPQQRLDGWLGRTLGSQTRIKWEANDCGEQTGSAADKDHTIPTCVEAEAALSDGRTVIVSISVGTLRTGISSKPSVRDLFILQAGSITEVKRLSELQGALHRK